MKTIFILMLPLHFGPVCSNILSTPKNEAVLKGFSKELVCRVNSGSSVSSWTFTAAGSNKDVAIYSLEIGIANNVTSFRKATDKDGFLNMKTDSAQPQDAGIYTCNIRLEDDSGIRIVQRSAHLIVLDSDPSCTAIDYSANGRKFKRLSCSVGFRGNWVPVMEWRQGGYNGTIVTTGVRSNTSENSTTLSLTIPLEASEANAFNYACITFFSVYMGNIIATANNTPDYTYTWPKWSYLLPDELPVPANAVVIQGSDSKMVCKKDLTSTIYNWKFTLAGSSTAVVIFSRESGIHKDFPRHQYNDDHALCKLVIKSTQLEDAGTYTCTKPTSVSLNNATVQKSAQLIVIESDPICSEEESQEETNGRREKIFHLRCTVVFRGNWAPLMEWRFGDAHGEIIEQRVYNSIVSNHHVTSSLKLVASSTRQNAKYTCRTYFGKINSSVVSSAKNIPDYNYTWTSSVINESNDVSIVTLVVSLAVVIIAILVALIVYHMVFKSFLADRHRIPPTAKTTSFQTVQECEYDALSESETHTNVSREHQLEEQLPGAIQGEVSHSVAYSSLLMTENPPPHYYRELPLPSLLTDAVQDVNEVNPYANAPVMVDSPTASTSNRNVAKFQQAVDVQ